MLKPYVPKPPNASSELKGTGSNDDVESTLVKAISEKNVVPLSNSYLLELKTLYLSRGISSCL
jgi:hypothetical protein